MPPKRVGLKRMPHRAAVAIIATILVMGNIGSRAAEQTCEDPKVCRKAPLRACCGVQRYQETI